MTPGIVRHVTKLFGNPQQLVVLGDALAPGGAASLDLSHARRHGEIRDERILRLTGAMRDHRAVAVGARQLDALKRLRERADLVHLDQDRVRDSLLNPARQPLGVRAEEVIADELYALLQRLGQLRPPRPIILRKAVFDRDDRVAIDPALVESDHLFSVFSTALALLEDVAAVLIEFGC